MSKGATFPWDKAMDYAERIHYRLAPLCQPRPEGHRYIEIAGSLRRGFGRDRVGDIEIVLQPRYETDLMGNEHRDRPDLVTRFLERHVALQKNGKRYKRFVYGRIPVDLHLVHEPGRWGWRLLLSTGSAKFNKWLVTPRPYGARPDHVSHKEGWLMVQGDGKWPERADTPTEEAALALFDLPYIPPEDREPGRWEAYVPEELKRD